MPLEWAKELLPRQVEWGNGYNRNAARVYRASSDNLFVTGRSDFG